MKKIGKWSSFNLKGTRKAMKSITLGLMFLGLFSTATFAASGMKGKRVNLKLNNVRLSEVFSQVESQSDFVFVYNESQIDPAQLVSVDAKNESVEEVLKTVLGDVSFKVYENQIIIKKEYNTEALSTKTETASTLLAQQNTVKVSGTIVDNSGYGIPGVNVSVKGTTNGTITNFDGKYEFDVPADAILVYSFIGFETQEIALAGRTSMDVTMQEEVMAVDEVVVTALGIKREKKALGYAATEVKGEEITTIKENNVINGLAGKVAGVQISKPSGGPGASTRVVIRGVASLNKNNQPLYVIDGVPIINDIDSNAENKDHGGIDSGDGISSINPDDIETMNVLKGPAATALYGSRASNGVILITTKKGSKSAKGLGVSVSSSVMFETPALYPDYQTTYAHGLEGKLPQTEEERYSQHSMWGPKIEGQDAVFFDGETRKLQVYDNYKEFYELGRNINNAISINGASERTHYRFSFANLNSTGIVPNTDFKRNNVSFRGGMFLDEAKKIAIDSKISYVKENADNRPITGASPFNVLSYINSLPNTYDINWLKDYKDENGYPVGYTEQGSNPYWYVNEIQNSDERNRVFGFASLNLELTSYLKFMMRAGTDFYTRQQYGIVPRQTPGQKGHVEESTQFSREDNFDALLSFDKKVHENFNVSANVGANRMYKLRENKYMRSQDFEFDDLQNVNSGKNNTHRKSIYEKEIQSVFGSLQLQYKNFYYLEMTARNDWSSTLPKENWSYFYPSVSTSIILNEIIDMPIFVSFAKIRGSWAEVGSDTDPYTLFLNYNLDSNTHDGITAGNISNGSSPLYDLKPERTESVEFGADLKFFSNRLGLDFTWYKQNTFDQILDIGVSSSTSYDRVWVNAGEIENKGYEIMLYATPVKTKSGFNWDVNFNFSKNSNKVIALTDEVEVYSLMSGAGTNSTVSVRATAGDAYGTIYGHTYQKDPNGNIIMDSSGLPKLSDQKEVIGNVTPDWMMGVNNVFTYKGISLRALVDLRVGGEFYAGSEAGAYSGGKHKNTLPGRAEFIADDSFVPAGVVEVENDGVITYEANAKNVKPEDYYGRIARVDEQFIYGADFVKLRELSLKYTLPKSLLEKTPLTGASIAVSGRNLFYFYKQTDNVDPESFAYTSGNGQGLEHSAIASTKTFGFSLNLRF